MPEMTKQWKPGDPLFKPAYWRLLEPMFSIKNDSDAIIRSTTSARWTPEDGWRDA